MPKQDLTIQRWVRWMHAQSWSENTVGDRVALVVRVAREHRVHPLDLTFDQVQTFLAGRSFGSSTRRLYWVILRGWFTWCVEEGLREDNPTDRIPKPSGGRRRTWPLAPGHIEALLATRMGARTRSMALLMIYQGFRVSDVAKMHSSNVDRVGRTLYVPGGKGDVTEYLPLSKIIAEESEQYPRGYWFPGHSGPHVKPESVTELVGNAMRRAGIPGTPHALRHFYANELQRQGVPVRVIQRLMRHATLATTELYLHTDDDDLHAGIARLPDLRGRHRAAA